MMISACTVSSLIFIVVPTDGPYKLLKLVDCEYSDRRWLEFERYTLRSPLEVQLGTITVP